MPKKVNTFRIIFIISLIILFAFGVFKYSFRTAESASSDNTSGYAWSDTIGWISFNCTDNGACGSSNYGVSIGAIDPITGIGNFSGYAWSENIGWISFAPSGPYPEAPNYSARYNSNTDKVTGWARVESNGGGWDGWILLGKDSGGWSNQVTIDLRTSEFHGWAWGSDVVGWISFNCSDRPGNLCGTSDYKVIADINFPPTVTCNNTETWDFCTDSRNPFLDWDYSDSDGDPQASYQLQIDDNSNFSSPEIDTGIVDSSGTTYHPSGQILQWGTTYYWRVKVKDSRGAWSGWSSNCSFAVPPHAYPDTDFTWLPSRPSALEPVQFTDQTNFYNGQNSWSWTFGGGAVPASSVLQNPVTTFSNPGDWEVRLEATDADGFMCPEVKTINVSYPLPDWEEVIPR